MAKVGDEYTQPNGYTRVKTEDGWVGKQRIIAEQKLGRPLSHTERVAFADGDKTNFDPDNIVVKKKKSKTTRSLVAIEHRLEKLEESMEVELEAIRQSLIELRESDDESSSLT